MNVKTDHAGMATARPASENGLVPVHVAIKRNEGTALEPSLFEAVDVNLSAAERRACKQEHSPHEQHTSGRTRRPRRRTYA